MPMLMVRSSLSPIAYALHKLRYGRKKQLRKKYIMWMPLEHTHVRSNFDVCNL